MHIVSPVSGWELWNNLRLRNDIFKKLLDLDELYRQPAVCDATGFYAEGVNAIYFEGLDFKGNPTRVFAWDGFFALGGLVEQTRLLLLMFW